MKNIQTIKRTIIRNVALSILGKSSLENLLYYLCSNKFISNKLRLGSIPFSYLSILDKPEPRVADMGNYKVWVNISDYLGMKLYFFREHTEPFAAWLASELINPEDVCIDIGANMGSYTFLMANKVGHKGRVVAFEPHPDLYKLLVNSVNINQFNDFVSVDNRALYSHSGDTLKFYVSENINNSGHSSLVNHGVSVSEDNFIQVQTVTLTDYCQASGIEKCHLVKIDVERAEAAVLQGMKEMLKNQQINYIILEQNAGSESQDFLDSMGYTCWLIDENQKALVSSQLVEIGYFSNYLFASLEGLAKLQNNSHIAIKSYAIV